MRKEDVLSAYEQINLKISSEIKGGREVASFDRYVFLHNLKRNSWDGIYAGLKGLAGYLKDHKHYDPEWSKSQKSEDLISAVLDLASLVKASFSVTL